MAMSGGNDDGQPMMEMNTTPLIDVMLVLLVIFMVTAPFVPTSTIDLPAVDATPRQPEPYIEVQVAADGNTSETMYPDQSLYAYDSVPTMVRRINNTFKRADEIQWSRGIEPGHKDFVDYFLPIVADAEAGFGGVLNAFELMKNMIAAGKTRKNENASISSRPRLRSAV